MSSPAAALSRTHYHKGSEKIPFDHKGPLRMVLEKSCRSARDPFKVIMLAASEKHFGMD